MANANICVVGLDEFVKDPRLTNSLKVQRM